ncbi:MAG: hypothetical protein ACYCPN_06685 [Thermoplasmata archaeon]
MTIARRMRWNRWLPAVGAVLITAALLTIVLPTGVALPAATPRASVNGAGAHSAPSTEGWAYGRVVEVQYARGGYDDHGVHLRGRIIEGYSVVLNQTNTSTGFQLEVTRTDGISVNLTFCSGVACTTPVANFTYRAWERSVTFGNFTTNGTVTSLPSGSPVAAVALINSTGTFRGALSQDLIVNPPIMMTGTTMNRSLSASLEGNLSATFTPPIGLYPTNLSATPRWVSQSNYTALGNWTGNFSSQLSLNGTPFQSHSQNLFGSVNRTGSLTLHGAVVGAPVPIDNQTADQILLGPEGSSQFEIGDGFILLPRAANLMGQLQKPWGRFASGAAWSRLSTLEVATGAGRLGHVGLLGSAWVYNLDSTNPLMGGGNSLTSIGPSNTTATASSLNVTQNQVQSRPETVPQAESSSACLQQGACSASTVVSPLGPGSAAGLSLGPVLAVALSVSAAIALAALVVARRRPPRTPNSLRPEGYTPNPPPDSRSSAPAEPGPTDEDPLRDLW